MLNELNLTVPCNRLSYGYVGVNLLKELLNLGIKINLFPIGEMDVELGHAEFIKKGIDNAKNIGNPSHNLIVWHLFGLQQFKQPNIKNIGFSIFEINRLTQQDAAGIYSMDAMITTCDFYKKILEKYSVKPVYSVPLGVDQEIFNPKLYHKLYLVEQYKKNNRLNFLSIGKWEIRKCYDKIAKCMAKAFNNNSKVSLTLCCHNPFLLPAENEAWKNLFKSTCTFPINFVERLDKSSDIASLIVDSDVYLGPSLAEGFGLPLAESLAMNKPSIATNYGGYTEFCTSENCYLIDIDETEPAFDGQFFHGDGEWAKFGPKQEEQFVGYLREIYDKWTKGIDFSKKRDSMKEYTWKNTVYKILNVLGN